MPFRRIRRRHTALPGALQVPSPGRSLGEAGGVDPVTEMKKRKEAEEANDMARMTSDILAYCMSLLHSLIGLLTALIYYNYRSLQRESSETEDSAPEDRSDDGSGDVAKKRYKKVVVTNNVVDMFNSHGTGRSKSIKEGSSPTKHNELMDIFQKKQDLKLSSPTPHSALLSNTSCNSMMMNRNKSVDNENVDLTSMMYTGRS